VGEVAGEGCWGWELGMVGTGDAKLCKGVHASFRGVGAIGVIIIVIVVVGMQLSVESTYC